MLSSITPLGERARDRSWGRTVSALVVGSAAGGAVTGAAAGLLGAPVPPAWRVPLAAGLGAVVLLASRAGRLPSWQRQVDETWLTTYRDWVTGLGYGAQLGAAFATIVASAATWMTFLLAAATGSPRQGALVGLAFGLARALPVLAARRVHAPEDLARLHERLATAAVPAERVATAVAVAVVAGLLAAAFTGVDTTGVRA